MKVRVGGPVVTGGPLLGLLAVGFLLVAPAGAQVASIVDVSPDMSNHDPSDPDAASGGRVNGIVVDPNDRATLYAASEWGGVYQSVDSGLTWQRFDAHRPTVTWDVAVDPSNSNRLYATSFFDGRSAGSSQSGINVSTDRGATWTRPASVVPPAGFCADPNDQVELTAFGISIDPSDSTKVYVGTSCGLAMSADSGSTWTYSKPPVGAMRMWDVLVRADGSAVDTCGDSGHWQMNTTTGAWTQSAAAQLPSGRCSLAASPYDQANLFAVVGTRIYESKAAGEWVNTRSNPSPQGRIPFVATNVRSSAPAGSTFDLWFGDVSVYRVACDRNNNPSCGSGSSPPWQGGYTRSAGGHDDMGDIAFDPSAANDACPVAMSSDGGVYRNLLGVSPACHAPSWEQPDVTPHGLWPFAMSGADRAGSASEDLYFGNQDNGVFGTLDAGAAKPSWDNEICCDGFDTAADDFNGGAVLYSVCCFGGGRSTRYFKKGPLFAGGGEINYPPGSAPSFKYPDSFVRWDDKKYAMVTRGPSGGLFITHDADAVPIEWIELGSATEPPTGAICGVKAGLPPGGTPTFYVQTGSCNATSTGDRLFRFVGTDPSGVWTEIVLPQGGVGVFDVNASDPTELLAAGFTSSDARMYRSSNSGDTWSAIPQLDDLMRGGGEFPITNERGPTDFTGMNGYHQPSLVGLDPTDPDVMVAGGRDSGIFLSTDGGSNWSLVTDPRNSHTSGTPHLPRPRFAYFDQEGAQKSVFIGSQGRGIWRLTLGASFQVSVAGSCPGPATVMISNAPPNAEVAVLRAANTNGWTKGGSLCNGAQFEIGEPFVLPPVWVITDGTGSGSAQVTLPVNRCWVEGMETTTCQTSGASLVP